MPFINLDDFEPIELAPGVIARTPYGERLMLSYVEVEEGSVVPTHQHPHEQAGIVLEGKMEITIGEESRICNPGDMFIVPPETPHSFHPIGGPVKSLDAFSPVREDYAARFNQYV